MGGLETKHNAGSHVKNTNERQENSPSILHKFETY